MHVTLGEITKEKHMKRRTSASRSTRFVPDVQPPESSPEADKSKLTMFKDVFKRITPHQLQGVMRSDGSSGADAKKRDLTWIDKLRDRHRARPQMHMPPVVLLDGHKAMQFKRSTTAFDSSQGTHASPIRMESSVADYRHNVALGDDEDGPVPQLDWWEGPRPEGASTSRLAKDMCGTYFNDVSENVFLAKESVYCTTEHVDQALRTSGLIMQTGSISRWWQRLFGRTRRVVFDEGSMMWVDAVSRTVVRDSLDSITERVDHVPSGIISVVGKLDFRTFVASTKQKSSRHPGKRKSMKIKPDKSVNFGAVDSEAAPRGAHSAAVKQAADAGLAAEHTSKSFNQRHRSSELESGYDVAPIDCDDDDEQMIMVIGDPDSEFLDHKEVVKFIKHYLTRSIIKAARTARASIVTGGCDDISRQLALGYRAFLDPVGVKVVKSTAATQLVGVHPLCDKNYVHLHFSHHILLRSGGGHRFEASGSSGPTCAYCHSALTEVDNPDEFCTKHPDYSRVFEPRAELHAMRKLQAEPKTQRAAQPASPLTDQSDFNRTPFALDTTAPSPAETRDFKQRMLESLNQGYHQRLVRDALETDQPPNRSAIPVMLILFGGDETSRDELHAAVARGWPILVVEGSGGYADIISSTISKVNALSPDASQDDYRALLSGVDVVTSEVIVNGKWHVIRKGTDVGQVERLIQTALKGDEILHQAWRLFSVWRYNEKEWLYHHQVNQLAILMLGILATLASVAQTFMILLYRDMATSADFISRWAKNDVRINEKYWYMSFRLLQWLVIGLPITLTLVHAIFQRMNPWAKLSALRIASSSLLREIYVYRTKTLGYSSEAIKKGREHQGLNAVTGSGSAMATSQAGAAKASKMLGGEGIGGVGAAKHNKMKDQKTAAEDAALGVAAPLSYASREELLGYMIRQIQHRLGLSDAGSVLLYPPIDNNLPPSSITSSGDSGVNDLTPDDYVGFRLKVSRLEYEERHAQLEVQATLLTTLVILSGALGTALAALSAYGLGYLQAWVAFFTVVMNSLTRFLDFTRIAAMSELCNTAEHRLSDVERWWSSLGTDADSDKNRTKLVSDTERILTDEIVGWSKQMQSHDEDRRRDDDGDEEASKSKEDRDQQAGKASLGADMFAKGTITKCLSDKNGPTSQKLKRQILDLNDKLGGVVRVSNASELVSSVDGAAVRPEGGADASSSGQVPSSSSAAKKAAYTVPQVFLDRRVRSNFLKLLLSNTNGVDYRCLTGFTLRKALAHISSLTFDELQSMLPTTLHCCFVAKQLVLREFEDIFRDVLRSMPAIATRPEFMESFITELFHMHVVCGAQLQLVSKESLAQIVDDANVKEAVLQLPRQIFRDMLDLCETVFASALGPSHSKSKGNFGGRISTRLLPILKGAMRVEAYERVHVEMMSAESDAEDAQFMIARLVDAVVAHALPIELATKEDLTDMLPPRLLADWGGFSGQQLVECMRSVGCGTAASRSVNASHQLLAIQCESNTSLLEWLADPSCREALVSANELLTQLVINRTNKTGLIRAMQAARNMTKAHADTLGAAADELALKAMLSTLQARQSNCFSCFVVQHLADSFFLVDFKDILSGDETECLANSVGQLGPMHSIGELSKDELLYIVPLPSLRKQLSSLDESQLRALFQAQRIIMCRSYYDELWVRVIRDGGIGSAARQRIVSAIHGYAAQRLIFRVIYMSEREMLELSDCSNLSEILQRLGDAVVSAAVFGLHDDPRQEVNFAMELSRIMEDMYELTHEPPTAKARTLLDPQHPRNNHPLLVQVCHHMIDMQPSHLQKYAKLFFRMTEDATTVDNAALNRLIDTRADTLILLDETAGSDDVDPIADMLSLFRLEDVTLSQLTGFEDVEHLRVELEATLHDSDHSLLQQLKGMLVEMDITLDLELPYLAFEEIAQRCTQFDLRDLIVNSTDRHSFAVSWLEFCGIDRGMEALRNVRDVALLHGDQELAITFDVKQSKVFQKRLLHALDSIVAGALDNPGASLVAQLSDLDLLASTVRSMPETHVVQLCTVIERFMFHTSAGALFNMYCANRRQRATNAAANQSTSLQRSPRQVDGKFDVALSLEQIAAYILSIARGHKKEVVEAFYRWDITQFLLATDKAVHLNALIPNDVIITALLELPEKPLRWLFIMLQYSLDSEERKMLEDCAASRALRKRFDAQVAVGSASHDETRTNVYSDALKGDVALYDDDSDELGDDTATGLVDLQTTEE